MKIETIDQRDHRLRDIKTKRMVRDRFLRCAESAMKRVEELTNEIEELEAQ